MLENSIFSFSHVFYIFPVKFNFFPHNPRFSGPVKEAFRQHSGKSWLVGLGFNATLTVKVISWWSVTHMCFLVFSHASAELRGKNTPKRKVASTGDQIHNHQVMRQTRSPVSHPILGKEKMLVTSIFFFSLDVFNHIRQKKNQSLLKTLWEKEKLLVTSNFSFSHRVFYPFG